jgi:hypothetical protein
MTRALARALIDELARDAEALDLLADYLAPRLVEKLTPESARADGWLDAKQTAAYLALSVHALHKLSAAREIPFEQDGPGCKLWFQRSELDAWRCGERQRTRLGRAA